MAFPSAGYWLRPRGGKGGVGWNHTPLNGELDACANDFLERMHLDIRRELEGGRIGQHQATFDLWHTEYNTEWPHEPLGMCVPAKVYQPSARAYEGTRRRLVDGQWDCDRKPTG